MIESFLFADDTKIVVSESNQTMLQNDFDIAVKWSQKIFAFQFNEVQIYEVFSTKPR